MTSNFNDLTEFSETDEDDRLAGEAKLAGDAAGFRSDVEIERSVLRQHNPGTADLVTANRIAVETGNLAGASMEIYLRTDNADYDTVWDEDPDPTYWPPVIRKGFFAPKAIEIAMKQWGVDAPVNLDILFSLSDIRSHFGNRLLRTGDVIGVPFNAPGQVRPRLFRIITAVPEGIYRFSWLYLKCTAQSLTGDITVQPGVQPSGYPIIAIGDQYGE